MQDEVMKDFIEQVIECVEGISDALRLVLQHYHVNIAEREMELCKEQSRVTVDDLKEVLVEKTRAGKEDKIRQLFVLFRADKLSEVNPEDYTSFYNMAKDI